MRGERPTDQIALAVPDVVTYRGLIEKVLGSLEELGVWVLLVGRDGSLARA